MNGNFSKQNGNESVPNGKDAIPGNAGTLGSTCGYMSPLLDELRSKSLTANLSRDDLKTLRSRSFVLAARVAQSFRIAGLIRPAAVGFGFLIECPGISVHDESSRWGWWTLATLADGCMNLPKRVEVLRSGKSEPPAGDGLSSGGTPPDLAVLSCRFLLSTWRLPNRCFSDLVYLIDCCRFMHAHFPESVLWDRSAAQPLWRAAVFVKTGSNGDRHT